MSKFNNFWQRGRDFLNTEFAILGGAMTWLSDADLVSAISNEGAFGVVASGAMMPEQLDAMIKETMSKTKKPFGVNLITLHPNLLDLVEVCGKNKVSHVIFGGALPSAQAISLAKQNDAKVMAFAPNLLFAKKLCRSGVDAIIIEGSEAGGHIGPVSTNVLAQEILPNIQEVPVFVAGGIGRGETIAGYLLQGAAGCQLGTRFVCAHESNAHKNFKQAFIKANARDAIVSYSIDSRIPVIPVRSIANAASKSFLKLQQDVLDELTADTISIKDAQLKVEHFWAGALRRAVKDGDMETGSIMAGQSVGMVTCEQSMNEIIRELLGQCDNFLSTIYR